MASPPVFLIGPSTARVRRPVAPGPALCKPVDLLEQQGRRTLRDALRNVTGVSIQAGEGAPQQGGGDILKIRGFSAREDFLVNGSPDVGVYFPDPFNTSQVDGEQRVRGLEVSIQGEIVERWDPFAGYAHLDGKFVQTSFAPDVGRRLDFVAEHSASVWTSYALTARLKIGAALTERSGAIEGPRAPSTRNHAAEDLVQRPGAAQDDPVPREPTLSTERD